MQGLDVQNLVQALLGRSVEPQTMPVGQVLSPRFDPGQLPINRASMSVMGPSEGPPVPAQPVKPKFNKKEFFQDVTSNFLIALGAGLSNRGKGGQSTGAGAAMMAPMQVAAQRQAQQEARRKAMADEAMKAMELRLRAQTEARQAQSAGVTDQLNRARTTAAMRPPNVDPNSPEVFDRRAALERLTQGAQDKRQEDQQVFSQSQAEAARAATAAENAKNRAAAMARAEKAAAARIEAVRAAGLSGELSSKQVATALQLANSLKAHPAYTDMQDVATGMEGIESAIGQKSGIGDIAAINAFQRMVDPGATVREGDVALLRSAAALKDRVLSAYPIEKLQTGAVLPEATRQELLKTARSIYERRAKNYNNTIGTQYRALAKAATIPFEYIGVDFDAKPAAAGGWSVKVKK